MRCLVMLLVSPLARLGTQREQPAGPVQLALRVDPFYCRPAIGGAHEKDGVEGAVGWFRRHHLTSMLDVDTLDEGINS